MYITPINTSFSGKLNIVQRWKDRHSSISKPQQADTFVRTTSIEDEIKSIKPESFINEGHEASVFETNNKNYVLRIVNGKTYNPKDLIPVNDGNGLIVAVNQQNTVQLQKYVKGEPLYERPWNIWESNLTKDEYLETFDKIKNLPDESFTEYIRNILNFRKCGYEIDSVNPNNILLDGNHLNIVDIEKRSMVKPYLFLSDFDALVDRMHVDEMLSQMNKQEINKFAGDIKVLYDRIMNIAKQEGQVIDISENPHSTLYELYSLAQDSEKKN